MRFSDVSKSFFKPAMFVFCLLLAGCASQVKNTSRSFRTVVIDAGHGGHDSGALSRRGSAEKHAALDVSLRLEQKLRDAGLRTVMTRETDRFVPLDTRAAISNRQQNAIFVSIHFNHAKSRRARGVETYYNHPYAVPLARNIQNNLVTLAPNRGVHRAKFRVLRKNRYPAVLVECGFLSHSAEAARCSMPAYRERLASEIATAILNQRGLR